MTIERFWVLYLVQSFILNQTSIKSLIKPLKSPTHAKILPSKFAADCWIGVDSFLGQSNRGQTLLSIWGRFRHSVVFEDALFFAIFLGGRVVVITSSSTSTDGQT